MDTKGLPGNESVIDYTNIPDWIPSRDTKELDKFNSNFLKEINDDWLVEEFVQGPVVTLYTQINKKPWWKFWGNDEVVLGCFINSETDCFEEAYDATEKYFDNILKHTIQTGEEIYLMGTLVGPNSPYERKDNGWYLYETGTRGRIHTTDETDGIWQKLNCLRNPRISLKNWKGNKDIESLQKFVEEHKSCIKRSKKILGIIITKCDSPNNCFFVINREAINEYCSIKYESED